MLDDPPGPMFHIPRQLRAPRGCVAPNSVVTVLPMITAPALRAAPAHMRHPPASASRRTKARPTPVGMSTVSTTSLMLIWQCRFIADAAPRRASVARSLRRSDAALYIGGHKSADPPAPIYQGAQASFPGIAVSSAPTPNETSSARYDRIVGFVWSMDMIFAVSVPPLIPAKGGIQHWVPASVGTSRHRRSARSSLLPAPVVIVNFVKQAAAVGLERTVMRRLAAGTRRSARSNGSPPLPLSSLPTTRSPENQIHLFPMIVHEGRRGVDAGRKAQAAGVPAAHLAPLVEIARENLLLNARRITRRRDPALIHVDLVKLKMRLVHWPRFRTPSYLSRVGLASCGENSGACAVDSSPQSLSECDPGAVDGPPEMPTRTSFLYVYYSIVILSHRILFRCDSVAWMHRHP